MTFSIIQKSQLEGALRIDAEYYCQTIFLNKNYVLGKDAVSFIQYGTSEELNEEKKGFPVLRLNEFDEIFIKNPSKYCNKLNEKQYADLLLKKDDVLICRTNGNPKLAGKAAVVINDKDSAFASYLFRIRPKEEIINSATLVVFLNSRFGRQQIEKYLMPSIQSNFSPAKFREIRIPILPLVLQTEIRISVLKAFNLNNDSKFLYSQAEDLLLSELGLKDFELDNNLFNEVNLLEMEKVNRIDADYFQSKYEKLITKLKNYKPFSEVIQNEQTKFDSMKKPKDIFKYVELANIDSSIGVINGFSVVSGKEAPSRAKRILQEGDVIVSSIEGSLDKTALISKEQEGFLASTGFFQLRSDTILPQVLLVMAKSMVLQLQLKRECSGTILTAVPSDSLERIIVPIIPKPIQQKISELVKKSHEARKKSRELLQEAKRKVEEMIEEGGGS